MRHDPLRAREQRVQRLLEQLTESLLGAIAESPSVHRALARLERQGCTVQLSVGCAPAAPRRAARPVAAAPPQFRIDADDLAFLRSIGIDPTRRRRRAAT